MAMMSGAAYNLFRLRIMRYFPRSAENVLMPIYISIYNLKFDTDKVIG
jgi:hypothetical protein